MKPPSEHKLTYLCDCCVYFDEKANRCLYGWTQISFSNLWDYYRKCSSFVGRSLDSIVGLEWKR